MNIDTVLISCPGCDVERLIHCPDLEFVTLRNRRMRLCPVCVFGRESANYEDYRNEDRYKRLKKLLGKKDCEGCPNLARCLTIEV